ncbi:NAD-dependent epimerase/dehydratase family protein [Xanthobacter agilis]|uniref:NAD-dependent epimerase/dehydratase family protein n=1 Tax=Xanthobacter agilis TaxID=47492 RepID=UPI0035227696
MRIAIIGAYGLIGSYVSARLAADGHVVIGVGRDIDAARRRFPALEWKRADMAKASVADWAVVLAETEAVINCAGALQDGPLRHGRPSGRRGDRPARRRTRRRASA